MISWRIEGASLRQWNIVRPSAGPKVDCRWTLVGMAGGTAGWKGGSGRESNFNVCAATSQEVPRTPMRWCHGSARKAVHGRCDGGNMPGMLGSRWRGSHPDRSRTKTQARIGPISTMTPSDRTDACACKVPDTLFRFTFPRHAARHRIASRSGCCAVDIVICLGKHHAAPSFSFPAVPRFPSHAPPMFLVGESCGEGTLPRVGNLDTHTLPRKGLELMP